MFAVDPVNFVDLWGLSNTTIRDYVINVGGDVSWNPETGEANFTVNGKTMTLSSAGNGDQLKGGHFYGDSDELDAFFGIGKPGGDNSGSLASDPLAQELAEFIPPDVWDDMSNAIMAQNPGMTQGEANAAVKRFMAEVAKTPGDWRDYIEGILYPDASDTAVLFKGKTPLGLAGMDDYDYMDYVSMLVWAYDFEKNDVTIIVNEWLILHTRPTVYGKGRIVEIPEGADRDAWVSFEGRSKINAYAAKVISGSNKVIIGEKGELTDMFGRYWVAVGPKVIKPDFPNDKQIWVEDMDYGTMIDAVVVDKDENVYYIPLVVGDAKNHTYPNGVYQTGYPFPNGGKPSDYVNPHGDNSVVEFIGAVLPGGLNQYSIIRLEVH